MRARGFKRYKIRRVYALTRDISYFKLTENEKSFQQKEEEEKRMIRKGRTTSKRGNDRWQLADKPCPSGWKNHASATQCLQWAARETKGRTTLYLRLTCTDKLSAFAARFLLQRPVLILSPIFKSASNRMAARGKGKECSRVSLSLFGRLVRPLTSKH